jgi:UDP-N-acetyl-D-mannosaminuronic acid dehydrogenase
MTRKETLCVLGLGYIGLPTALFLAKAGFKVLGYDIIKQKITLLKKNVLPFEEPGLQELYNNAKHNFTPLEKLEQADAFIIAVPTPIDINNRCDLKYVSSAMNSIAPFLKKDSLVVLESTVSPKTTDVFCKNILEKSGLRAGTDFSLAFVSEKAIPGKTLHEMANNARIIGGIDSKSQQKTKEIYGSFVKGDIFTTDCTTAEIVKLLENTYRDVNIALANQFIMMGKQFGVNMLDAISLANKHPRVNIHSPGPGVGGHCIAIDPWFLIEEDNEGGLIKKARIINNSMPEYTVKLMKMLVPKIKPSLAILGAAYKKNIDDAREAPTIKIAEICKEDGWIVNITDPYVKKFEFPLVNFEKAISNADLILIAVDHDCYLEKEKMLLEKERKGVKILDARNLFNGRFTNFGANK